MHCQCQLAVLGCRAPKYPPSDRKDGPLLCWPVKDHTFIGTNTVFSPEGKFGDLEDQNPHEMANQGAL